MANLNIDEIYEDEPKPSDEKWFTDTVAIGRIEFLSVLNFSFSLPKNRIIGLVNLLQTNKSMSIHCVGSGLTGEDEVKSGELYSVNFGVE